METTTRNFYFTKTYLWLGTKRVKLVPLFAMGTVFRVSPNELVWVYEEESKSNSYHVPARLLEEVC